MGRSHLDREILTSSLGQLSPEEKNVRLGLVKHVVHPAQTLLDPEVPPLGLGHEVGLGDELGEVLGQHHVTVLVLVVRVLVAVVNVFLRHDTFHNQLLYKSLKYTFFT